MIMFCFLVSIVAIKLGYRWPGGSTYLGRALFILDQQKS